MSDERSGNRNARYESLMREIRGRRSVRRFTGELVPEGDVRRMLEAARWAPSPANRQPWRFPVVHDGEVLARMRATVQAAADDARTIVPEIGPTEYGGFLTALSEAPMVIVVLMRRPSKVTARAAAHLSENERSAVAGDLPAVGAAIQNLLLAAEALGWAACWMSAPLLAAPALRQTLGIPDTLDLAALIPIGRAAETPSAPRRRPLDQLEIRGRKWRNG